MKWVMSIVLLLGASWTMATEEDYWSSNGEKKVTKGAPDIKKAQVHKNKPIVLPAPGTDTFCMPAVANPQQMIDAMKSMFPGGKLPNPAEWQAFAQRVGGSHQQAAPSVEHCQAGDWISVGDKFTALELCDFDSTPASAASFGVCRYHGQARQVRKE